MAAKYGFAGCVCYFARHDPPARQRAAIEPMKISKVVIITNQTKPHAKQTAAALKTLLDREHVRQLWVEMLPPQRNLYRRLADRQNLRPDLVIASGDQHGFGWQPSLWLSTQEF